LAARHFELPRSYLGHGRRDSCYLLSSTHRRARLLSLPTPTRRRSRGR
jgi:hypothetical protein